MRHDKQHFSLFKHSDKLTDLVDQLKGSKELAGNDEADKP